MEKTKEETDGIHNRVLRSSNASLKQGSRVTIGPKPKPNEEIVVNRNEQGIESIEVVCKCGERIVIRCEYA